MSTTVIPLPAPPSAPKLSRQSSPLPGPLQDMNIDDLESELLTLAGHIAAAECRFLQYLAEFDTRRGWAGDGIRSCAHWLTWRAGMNLRTATEHLRIAHALTNLPRISEAFAAGKISYSKVRALTRVTGTDTATLARIGAAVAAGDPRWRHTRVADPEAAERVLLNLALSGIASHVETVVAAVRRMDTPPEDTAARRSLTWRHDDDGSFQVTVRFAPDSGAEFIAAINALVPPSTRVQRLGERSPEDLDERAREQEPGPVVDRLAARRADVLLALVTGTTDEEGPGVERGKAQVIVHFDVGSEAARIAGGPVIPAPTAERLFCDARIQLLLDDREGNRMYLGWSRRLATPAQIAALTVRDGGRCQFPGCVHARYLQAHHVVSWFHGGSTDIDNLILICSYHHGVVHDHGYLIRRLSGRWEFLRPDGFPIPAPAPLSGSAESLIEMHTSDRLRIDRRTLTPHWYGERLDPDPILEALLPRRFGAAA